jgi:GDP-4-dehydro-6-deoxy-D-mannose reductase
MTDARRIAITGGAGFVGGHLKRAFAADVVSRAVELIPLAASRQEAAQSLDITDAEAVAAFVASERPDAIVHLAAIAAPADARRDPGHAWRVNVDGTLNIARAILSASPRTRLVFAGSSEAYGAAFNAHGGTLAETAALQPMTAYAATKAAADIALGQMAHDGLDVVRFRPFNHTGPGQPPAYVVPAFASQVAAIMRGEAEPVVHVGNLDARRDFLDVRDVARAYRLAALAEEPFAGGPAVNLSTAAPRSIASILDALIARAEGDGGGRTIEIRTDPDRLRPSEVPVASGDNARAASLLGWKPEIDFDETVAAVLDHFLAAPRA